ncbi:MAG: ATP-binding protein [Promicromonosporaceae bacterium]|nr:ATP-binding protein [Promicromonosporaceae bacterium]
MERQVLTELLRWKDRPRKPLILRGARQVGKTWLIKEFGTRHFNRLVYVNFDESAAATALFTQDLDIERLLAGLALLDGGGPIDPANTLIAFDEIQDAPRAVSSLKYFAERLPGAHVIAAGSLLGVALHEGASFPVGKVEFLDLHPMTFTEFISAGGRADLASLIRDGDLQLTVPLHPTLTDLLRRYYVVGGMPEAVSTFLRNGDVEAARTVQSQLLTAYDQDFSKHAPPLQVPRIRQVFGSLPAQLARENRKFVYGLIRSGARAKEFETAINWLRDAGMVSLIPRITAPYLPTSAYVDSRAFKLFGLDVGLLGAQAGLDPAIIAHGDAVFREFRGALTEQYAAQQLAALGGLSPHYWTSTSGNAEVDFVVTQGSAVVPLEVKAEENTKAKSLLRYRELYGPRLAIRSAMVPYGRDDSLASLPLYALESLPRIVSS